MSPSRDARKMRRLRLRTVFSARRQSTSCQFRSSLAVFTRLSPRIERLPWFCNPSSPLGRSTRPASAPFSGRGVPQIEPLSAGLWFPLAFRLAAFAYWVFLSPLGFSARLAASLTVGGAHLESVFRMIREMRLGEVSPLRRGAVSARGLRRKSPTDDPLSPQSGYSRFRRPTVTTLQTRGCLA